MHRRFATVALAAAGFAGVLFAGTPATAASTTASATAVRVPTTARLWTATPNVHPGQTVRLTGTVTHGATNRRITDRYVALQYWNGKAFRTVATQKLIGTGWTPFTVPAVSRTYRLYFSGTTVGRYVFPASLSRVLTVRSTPWLASALGQRVVAVAAAQAGKPYVYAAAGPNAYDCSGLVLYAFRQFGRSLPHNANTQQRYGRAVSAAAAQPGDLVFFRDGSGYAYHVGIYAGGGYMIDAPHAGATVGRHRIWSSAVVYRRLFG